MTDLRAEVEGLAPVHVAQMYTATDHGVTEYRPDDCLYRGDLLALIPPGAVLVTEERLADEMHTEVYGGVIRRDHPAVLHGENVDCECETWAASILARIREGQR